MDAIPIAETLIERINARTSIADLYADDAILDANVPDWRFQIKGGDEVAKKFLDPEWWIGGSVATIGRTTLTARGAAFELESRFDRNGGEWLSRNLHILEFDDGLITRHTMYCTGDWNPETIARHAIEAPMVE